MMIALSLLLLALNGVDWMLTCAILENGGREMNPVMRWVIARWGYWALLAVKLAGAGMMIAVCLHHALIAPLVALCVFFAAVCLWNWRVLQRMDDD